jgi:hypothetical protein
LRSLYEVPQNRRGQDMPTLVEEVRTTALRQDNLGKVDVGFTTRGEDLSIGMGDHRAGNALLELRGELVTWIRVLWEANMVPRTTLCLFLAAPDGRARVLQRGFRDRPACGSTVESMAEWLVLHPSWLAEHEAAGELHDAITTAVAKCWWVIDRAPERWYAGRCGADDGEYGECNGEVYGHPTSRVARCRTCRAEYSTGERRRQLLKAAQKLQLSAADIAKALPNLMDRPLSVNTVRTWHHNGKIRASSRTETGAPLFLVGEVIDVALATPTRNRTASGPRGEGFVYFVQTGGLIKIGFTASVTRRMNELKPERQLALMPGTHRDEHRLHAAFAHLRHDGEWFRAEPDLLAYIDDVQRQQQDDGEAA